MRVGSVWRGTQAAHRGWLVRVSKVSQGTVSFLPARGAKAGGPQRMRVNRFVQVFGIVRERP